MSLNEALSLAYNSPLTIKEKTKSYKKAQAVLKSMLDTLFYNEGFLREKNMCLYKKRGV